MINSTETTKRLKDFINKPVTIFTENIGRNYTEIQYSDYFTGICVYVGNDIIETIHPVTKCKNLFFTKNIVAICEEQQLDPSNPEHQKIINEMNKPKENIIEEKQSSEDLSLSGSVNIDIDLLNKLMKN